MNVVSLALMTQIMDQRIKVYVVVLTEPMNVILGVGPSKEMKDRTIFDEFT